MAKTDKVSALLRPTIILPSRTFFDSIFAGLSPGPMTLVSSFFSDSYSDSDCPSFSQLLAGAMASHVAADGGIPTLPSFLVSNRIEVIDELVQQNEANLESFVVDEDNVVLSPKSGTSSKAKKRKLSNDGERDVDILKTALQDITSAIREGNASMEKSQGCFPRGELHKALEEIGIAPHLFTEAYLFLTKKSERMMQFFGCPVEYRKETLESMMYDPENRW
ncbi:putative WRKY transcription factor 4 [Camellia lanceoleosa]|uniref:WRKY transcription factor 4 n=1 Tax=Camellia lanceoleosa TaxID=1840588 RepID=A0ACC0H5R2_9ERIC|nr:putative WRKY transcription factor 4 [Camellia lanceoleosa]